jgi:hypothetical protein
MAAAGPVLASGAVDVVVPASEVNATDGASVTGAGASTPAASSGFMTGAVTGGGWNSA